MSEEVYNFVAANAEELDKAMDYKRNLSFKKHTFPKEMMPSPKRVTELKTKKLIADKSLSNLTVLFPIPLIVF